MQCLSVCVGSCGRGAIQCKTREEPGRNETGAMISNQVDSGYREFFPSSVLPEGLERCNLKQVGEHICGRALGFNYGCHGGWTDGGLTSVEKMGKVIAYTVGNKVSKMIEKDERVSIYFNAMESPYLTYCVVFPSRVLPSDPSNPITELESKMYIKLKAETAKECMRIFVGFNSLQELKDYTQVFEWETEADSLFSQ